MGLKVKRFLDADIADRHDECNRDSIYNHHNIMYLKAVVVKYSFCLVRNSTCLVILDYFTPLVLIGKILFF